MSVDISPKRPPMSSCTTEAPAGSGLDGGGSSTAQRSMRWIIRLLLRSVRTGAAGLPRRSGPVPPTCAWRGDRGQGQPDLHERLGVVDHVDGLADPRLVGRA